ncbi:MAG: NAD(P)/FAD-dependent oxidoreductase, partial [Acidimicrobiia bacterium]
MNEPISDEVLWEALQVANIPVLVTMLAQVTGDEKWLNPPYAPTRTRGMEDNDSGGLPPAVQEEIRRAAFEMMRRGKGERLPKSPSPNQMIRLMSVSMGEKIPEEYAGLMLEEMGALDRQPEWPASPDPDTLADFNVVVIGAGVSGVCAAVALERAGISYVVVESSDSVGGTWRDNQYPGCGVDTPSHLYSFSFAYNNWSRYFALQPEIQDYIESCVERFGIRHAIRLETEVLEASYDDTRARWLVEVRSPDGRTETLTANAVISAVGQLNVPSVPTLSGAGSFHGPAIHSARWPSDLDVTGKRVAVVGTGATAMQLVPAMAGDAERVTVFQRSPQWAAPATNYRRKVPEGVRYLMERFQLYASWYRCRLVWSFSDKVHESLRIDPDWPDYPRSINAINDGHRRFFTRHIEEELQGRQDLLQKVLPDYPPFAKRMLMDNGWFETLRRDDVELVDAAVAEVTETGLLDTEGTHYEVDVIAYATGFMTLRMIPSYDVFGRESISLRDIWGDDDARAYLGITVPGFPNFFCLYGPNTGLGHGGSVILLTESATRYIVALLQLMIAGEIEEVEVREDAFEEYNRRLDDELNTMIWNQPGVTNWYRNSRGRVVTNMP